MADDPETDASARPTIDATINAVYRLESPKLIAGLARIVRDVGLAEELVVRAKRTLTRNVPERDRLLARARVCGRKHERDEGGPERAQRGDDSVDRVGPGR